MWVSRQRRNFFETARISGFVVMDKPAASGAPRQSQFEFDAMRPLARSADRDS